MPIQTPPAAPYPRPGAAAKTNAGSSSVPENRKVYGVSELSKGVRLLLEQHFPQVWVEGELSNFSRPSSGHWYFTLKDDRAQLRCAMFKGRNRFLQFQPRNGMQVVVRGNLSLYEGRGDFQLIVEHMEPSGDGALRLKYEQLRQQLADEGLFADSLKRPLPAHPRHLAVITSATGAAIRDVLAVLQRRHPGLPVTLLPVPVQGDQAAPAILAAVARLADWPAHLGPGPDVAILTRGGGSLEDLWSFNDEQVARAVARCAVPLVVAVGHESDFCIAEFAADLRAATPSAAAELVAPDAAALVRQVGGLAKQLAAAQRRRLAGLQRELGHLLKRLRSPAQQLQHRAQRLDELEQRLVAAQQRRLHSGGQQLAALRARLRPPGQRLQEQQRQIGRLQQQLQQAMRQQLQAASSQVQHQQRALHAAGRRPLQQRRQSLAMLARALQAVSPLQTLARGFSILGHPHPDLPFGQPVASASTLQPGDPLLATLHDGQVMLQVSTAATALPGLATAPAPPASQTPED